MSELVTLNELSLFSAAFSRGIAGIVEAAQIYVRAIDENPANAERFREHFADTIPYSAWANFEAVGRKWMHPQLILGGMADRKKAAIIKRLPYDVQAEIIEKRARFPLLLRDGDTLQVSIQDATVEQTEQLVDGNHVRPITAQRAYLENIKERKTIQEAEAMPYVIRDGRVTFRRGVTMDRGELRRIIAEMR